MYICVDLTNDSRVVGLCRQISAEIPTTDLHVEVDAMESNNDRSGVETEQHITVLFGSRDSKAGIAKDFISSVKPFDITVTGVAVMQTDEFDVLHLKVSSKELKNVHLGLFGLCDSTSEYVGDKYTPHITVARMKAGTARMFVDNLGFKPFNVRVSSLTIKQKKGGSVSVKMSSGGDTETKKVKFKTPTAAQWWIEKIPDEEHKKMVIPYYFRRDEDMCWGIAVVAPNVDKKRSAIAVFKNNVRRTGIMPKATILNYRDSVKYYMDDNADILPVHQDEQSMLGRAIQNGLDISTADSIDDEDDATKAQVNQV
jgi:2'-5' RNA ligase